MDRRAIYVWKAKIIGTAWTIVVQGIDASEASHNALQVFRNKYGQKDPRLATLEYVGILEDWEE